ncbi:MAG: ATP-binding protein [Candidatus Latescibacteria bacterium]|nr:ATP-binding protein [Candidatus Latescibacterota bacterium]
MTVETLRVLIVDDEPGMRQGASRVLSRHAQTLPDLDVEVRFAVETAADAAEALARLTAAPWDLLLLDYKLPDRTGLEVLDEIRTRGIDVVTVMVTAYASLEVAVSATKNGAFDFLAKPFTPDELKTVVEKAARTVLAHRRALALAEEKRQVRFQFIRVLAHELKAPLGVVDSYLRMVQDRALGDELAAYDRPVERALVRIDGMRRMIVDLLDLTRLESGQKRRDLATVDVVEEARSGLEGVTAAAADRGIALELHAPATLPMQADRGELGIIFNNLLTNAVKYNRDGGRVDLTVRPAGDGGVELEVRDTGVGMAPADVARLFGEFVRIKNEKTKGIEGSGLGLSIMRKLAELYGGSVAVASEPDVGTTFTVTLAAAPQGTEP